MPESKLTAAPEKMLVRLPKDVRERLAIRAATRRTTMTAIVVKALRRYLADGDVITAEELKGELDFIDQRIERNQREIAMLNADRETLIEMIDLITTRDDEPPTPA